MESAHHGYLTGKEQEVFQFAQDYIPPFQVPCEIAHFIGREKIVEKATKEISTGGILLLHGPPGVGKTALAIKLGHLLSQKYPDGVLWYKVDSSNVMDILLSIARLFGEDISTIKDTEVRASIVRTLLANKKLLLIFDNVTNDHALKLLIPNSPTSSIIFTSQESALTISSKYISISVATFTQKESIELFTNIFNKHYVNKHNKQIQELAEKLGYLPLALQMAANYIKQSKVPLESYIHQLSDEAIDLSQMKYEDKSLLRAITISFNTLDPDAKSLFITLGIYEGKDFSLSTVAFVNKLSETKTRQLIQKLMDISLIEESNNNRYRIHPLIKLFVRKQIKDPSYYLKAAQYYEQLLARANEEPILKVLRLEVDSIIYIFKQCYENGYWDQVITLWNPIEKFLSDNNEIKKLRSLTSTIDTAPNVSTIQNFLTVYMCFTLIFWTVLNVKGIRGEDLNYWYGIAFTLIPLLSGLIGVFRSKFWGLLNTNIGKAVLFISAGIFSWGIGNMIWGYYNIVENIEAPYPSFADFGYFPAYLLWILGISYLSRATGAKVSLKYNKLKQSLLIIPIVIGVISYYLLFYYLKRSFISETPIHILFDLYYPFMDIVILTFAVIVFGLSVNFFGKKYRLSIFSILMGFTILFLADFFFSYTTAIESYYNGNFVDLLFNSAFFLLAWGALSFYLTPKHVPNSK